MNSTDNPTPQTCPLQRSRVKQAAHRLSNWTGVPLSESLELTARAYGTTSWNALLQTEEFLPDEALLDGDRRWFEKLNPRYTLITQLLRERLHLSKTQAFLLAQAWQPTALAGAYNRPKFDDHRRVKSGDLELLHVFGPHPALPPGALLALVSAASSRAIVAVRPGRLARFLGKDDSLPLEPARHIRAPLMEGWAEDKDDPAPKAMTQLSKLLLKKGVLALEEGFLAELARPCPPVRLKAAWLQSPRRALSDMSKLFAERYPWKHEDYPDLRKSALTSFWSYRLPGIVVKAAIFHGTVFIFLGDKNTHPDLPMDVQVGVGGLSRMQPESFGAEEEPCGYYLVKYGNQPRGRRPVAGMTPELAATVRQLTGLGGGDDDDDIHSHDVGGRTFFSTDAGLAFARWCAAFPLRMKQQQEPNGENYLGWRWWKDVHGRMEFELARAGALG